VSDEQRPRTAAWGCYARTGISLLFGVASVVAGGCGGGGGGGGGSPAPTPPPPNYSRDVPIFQKPFNGEYVVANFHDHNLPKEFVDTNGVFVTFWGETANAAAANMVDGHEGYDFLMPEGTPLLAVADGRVVDVQDMLSQPFFCPPLNRYVTQQKGVYIEHVLPDGRRIWSWPTHMSRIDVTVGMTVTAGQQVGLSGNTGCSGAPHLHFEVFLNNGARLITIDPFGWTGAGADPWEDHPDGAASIQLWKRGQAPQLARNYTYDLNSVAPFAPAYLTNVVYQGVRDDLNPNNEYVDLTLDPRVAATVSLNGYRLTFAKANVTYTIPNGITLNAQAPSLRIFVGPGTDNGQTVYMGQSAGIVSNVLDDCIGVVYPNGAVYRFNLGACP
jgi:hypothetical protein